MMFTAALVLAILITMTLSTVLLPAIVADMWDEKFPIPGLVLGGAIVYLAFVIWLGTISLPWVWRTLGWA